jgi:crotonobetainyl-CoA:carnitine CoA-transferase CaiB-like acyl-CoA transferase
LAPFGIFPAADGHIALCAPTDPFARGVFLAMDRSDLADDPSLRTRDKRIARADELHQMISEWSKGLPVEEALAALTRHGVPAAKVRDPHEAVQDPLVRQREEVVPITHHTYGAVADLSATGVPIRFSGSNVGLNTPAPTLGQHNDQVFRDLLGYSDERFAELVSESII